MEKAESKNCLNTQISLCIKVAPKVKCILSLNALTCRIVELTRTVILHTLVQSILIGWKGSNGHFSFYGWTGKNS